MKVKYYFATSKYFVEFNDAAIPDNVHKEVDGMKMEHSFTTFDLRSIPLSDIHDVIHDSRLWDRAILIPSNYELPAINVDVLSKLDVRCT